MTTNPYTLLIEMQLDGDYIKQEAAVAFAKEYARLEIERITKQTGTNTLVSGSLHWHYCKHCGAWTDQPDSDCYMLVQGNDR